MTDVITLTRIKEILAQCDLSELIKCIEDGFIAYSEKQTVVPPAGHLQFKNPPGDVHIKYGYVQDDDVYVIKVASSFYDNPKLNLPSSHGCMLVFSKKTGELLTILLDEGFLTDVRTALAGAVVAKHLAPKEVHAIGIVGTGTQARFQLQYLKDVIDCRKVYVYGRSNAALQSYAHDMRKFGFEISTTRNMDELTEHCNYIVTTTPSNQPLIKIDQVKPGTHITAMGSDAPRKQELDPRILQKADIVVADSISQCQEYGEVSAALQQELIPATKLVELGDLIKHGQLRENDEQITIADLTGVAVEDIQIAKLISVGRFQA